MMWGYGTTYTWGGMLLMLLSMLFWFALLGALIWALVHWVTRSAVSSGTAGSPSALEILQQRYARGEIDDATFARMRQHLLGSAFARDDAPPSITQRMPPPLPSQ
jgi:putative membrane protein